MTFEIDTGQIVEDEAHTLWKSPLIKLLFQIHPMAVELIHGGIDIVFIEGFVGLEAAGLRQPGALGFLGHGQLGAGKEQTAIDDGLEQAALTGRAHAGEQLGEPKRDQASLRTASPP